MKLQPVHQRNSVAVVTFRAALASAAAAVLMLPGAAPAAEFTYNGDTGPGYWSGLDAAWQSCGAGSGQSPIDVTESRPGVSLGALAPALSVQPTPLNITNNGHTIENEYEPGSSIVLDGIGYGLTQFHFHTLSEHSIDGQRGAMELHAVFKDAVTGNIVVIGQLFKIGAENAFLAQFDGNLPDQEGEVITSGLRINVTDAFRNLGKYYRYAGSLTTPPCSPVVTWIVLEDWATMSAAQSQRFNKILGNNFRPQQPLGDRTILRGRGK